MLVQPKNEFMKYRDVLYLVIRIHKESIELLGVFSKVITFEMKLTSAATESPISML